jgi:hypothetical protein
LGGVIGGALESARTLSTIKKARIQEDIALKPFNSREVVQEATSPADRIILATENRDMTARPLLTLTGNPAEDALRKLNLQTQRLQLLRKLRLLIWMCKLSFMQ